ncbi:MAG TPA: efflux RND transporter periplasmic adaptor subunit [Gemmatimonadaceae bacterium]|jgi:membrane fusion protein (multidrug efflux system)|nr:efflux RND transporter periplasmic adaptor subunit [Gemmatimonadaceae bacterium]
MRRILILALLFAGFGCRGSDPASATHALVQVKTASVTIAPFAETISSIATVGARAGHIASLSAPAPARIAAVHVSQGQKVGAGTALVSFEQAPFIAAAQSAEAGLIAAQRNYERARSLADAGIVPKKDADQAATELAQARATATTARRTAQLAVLRAPISGVVTRLDAPLGAQVDVTQPIVEVADLGALDIIFNVSPADAARIAPGASVTLSAGESAKGEPLGVGHIIDVGGTVDSATRSVAVRALAPPTARALRIGETVFGEISTAVHPRAIVIPVAALVPDGDGYKVFVVGPGNIARERKVTIGRRNETNAEVLTGLTEGEVVVTEGAYGLEDSVKVTQAK